MLKFYYVIVFLYSLTIYSQKSNDSISYQEFKIYNAAYKDFTYTGNSIYGLTKGDSLIIWDIAKNSISEIIPQVSSVALKNDNVFYIQDNIIRIHNKSVTINYPDKLKGKIYKLLFDKDDNPVISTSKGIYYEGEYYVPDHNDGLYLMDYASGKGDDIVSAAKVFYLDNKQRLWLGFDNGEYTGGLILFDIKERKFINQQDLLELYATKHNVTVKNFNKLYDIKKKVNKKKLLKKYSELIKITKTDTLYKFPYDFHVSRIKGIASNDEDYYISESLFNIMLQNAKIIKISKSLYKDFYKIHNLDELLEYQLINDEKNINEYVGPVSYNKYNSAAYYYSNLGFFRIIEGENGKFSKELLLKPKALWTAGMPDAVGYAMNVTKFEFIDKSKFIFLTTNNGLGYYNGKDVIYYK